MVPGGSFTGTGEKGAKVTLSDHATGKALCAATVTDAGTFTCTPSTPLPGGKLVADVKLVAAPDGFVSTSTGTFTVTKPSPTPTPTPAPTETQTQTATPTPTRAPPRTDPADSVDLERAPAGSWYGSRTY